MKVINYLLKMPIWFVIQVFQLFGRKDIIESKRWIDGGRAIILGAVFPLCRVFRFNGFLLFIPHEKSVVNFLKKLTGKVFIDVGANIGVYTSLLSKNFKVIYAVEPHPEDARILRVKLPNCHNVVVVEKALANTNGTAFFSYRSQSLEHFRNEKKIMVETMTLSNFLQTYSIKEADLVKVDVEGAEWKVLEGAEAVLGKIKSWVIKLHDIGRKNDLEMWFQKNGYKFQWLDYNHIYAER